MTTNANSRWSATRTRARSRSLPTARSPRPDGRFVADNYAELKRHKLFSAAVPSELGGGGASHAEICGFLRELAPVLRLDRARAVDAHASGCGGGLALPPRPARRSAAAQDRRVRARAGQHRRRRLGRAASAAPSACPAATASTRVKRFGSGCSGRRPADHQRAVRGSERGAPRCCTSRCAFSAPGRYASAKTGTRSACAGPARTRSSSRTCSCRKSAISLRRPRGQWHPSWNVVVGVASPIYMAPYIGIAERAAQLALETARKRSADAIAVPVARRARERALRRAHGAPRDDRDHERLCLRAGRRRRERDARSARPWPPTRRSRPSRRRSRSRAAAGTSERSDSSG